MKIYLIRHGKSTNNEISRSDPIIHSELRVKDPGLSPNGISQAQTLIEYLRNIPLDKVVSSPMLRSLQTTAYGLVPLGIQVEILPYLYEKGGIFYKNQVFPGMNKNEILELFPNYNTEQIPENGYYFKDHIETDIEFLERVQGIIQEFYKWNEQKVAVVIHEYLIKSIINEVLKGCGLDTIENIVLDNCGVTLLEKVEGKYLVKFINHHLIINNWT
ncbi:hypothetical protein SteCoe_28028 [Stentor coeruleus]|uniref:Phosphoglycerate mutase n=1 Tax=Stentor coeruleus TaxID=5963 RepID=A0A1R2B947_9CILI|nr:hypothetical protein SteCoe_28028 [Stentor coeruleus]